MSRLAKKGISIPNKTDVIVGEESVIVKGPLGELTLAVRPNVAFAVADSSISLTPANETLETKALVGTYASILRSMVAGVNTAFKKTLVLEGVGYRAEVKGKDLAMALGFSHPVNVPIPEGLTVTVEKGTMNISGIDKQVVGQFAAKVRGFKMPEPYKGKGFRYSDEVIRRKQGKKSV